MDFHVHCHSNKVDLEAASRILKHTWKAQQLPPVLEAEAWYGAAQAFAASSAKVVNKRST